MAQNANVANAYHTKSVAIKVQWSERWKVAIEAVRAST